MKCINVYLGHISNSVETKTRITMKKVPDGIDCPTDTEVEVTCKFS